MWEINWFLKNIGKISMTSFTCSHFGRWYHHEKILKRHVRSSHMNQKTSSCDQCGKSFTRSTGLEQHRRTGAPAAVVPTVAGPAAKKRCTDHGVAPERLQFKLL